MNEIPTIPVGWLFIYNNHADAETAELDKKVCDLVEEQLSSQFTGFNWKFERVVINRILHSEPVDPLKLLDIALQFQIANKWEYTFVTISNGFLARNRSHTYGVPSSILDIMAFSLSVVEGESSRVGKLATIALHLFGHTQGLEHKVDNTPMALIPHDHDFSENLTFSADEKETIARVLTLSSKNYERKNEKYQSNGFSYIRVFFSEPLPILTEVYLASPWKIPVRLNRTTGITLIGLINFVLAAEPWQVGVNTHELFLIVGTLVALLSTTTILFRGQSLQKVPRNSMISIQIIRTRTIIFLTLFSGLTLFWFVLFLITLMTGMAFSRTILESWTLVDEISIVHLSRQAAFLAFLGIVVGAFGSSLEQENGVKAEIFFDEET